MNARARQLRIMTIRGRIEQQDGRYLLHLRNGDVQLNAAAATLLSLCDGTRSLQQIVGAFAVRHADACSEQTHRFLEIAAELGWIRSRVPRRDGNYMRRKALSSPRLQ